MTDDWITRFPGLDGLAPDMRDVLVGRGVIVDLPRGTRIFGPGLPPADLLLLLDGTVRVHRTSEQGRDIVLYRVNAGESCVLTTAAMLSYGDHTTEGHAETDLRAVNIPRGVFDDLVARSAPFRAFVFAAYAQRITDLFQVIEEIAFQRLDIRLAQRLLTLAGPQDAIAVTHQELAVELGTAREVISRQLAEFQRRGWVAQARGRVTLLDAAAIAGLAAA